MPSTAEGQPQAKRLPGMLNTLPCPGGGERLASPPGAAVTSPALLGEPRLCPLGWDPGSSCQPGVRHRWCFTGKDWDTLEEGLGLQGRVEQGKGPRSGAHSRNADSFDN